MTHDEAAALLPAYALGALDGDAASVEAHARDCVRCTVTLGHYLETTATLAEAVTTVAPPVALRDAVLGRALPPARTPRRIDLSRRLSGRFARAAASLLLVAGVAFGAGSVAQQRQLDAARAHLSLDERGLALLTSTETHVDRLSPVVSTTTNEHGHWYHRPGIDTEVVVVEFMPPTAAGEAYDGWLQRRDGSWISVGQFTLDDAGYGRLILLGSDGTESTGVTITRQDGPSAAPSGTVVLTGTAG